MSDKLFLGLTGSVAAVKVFHLLEAARTNNFEVRWHATRSAQPFIIQAILRKLRFVREEPLPQIQLYVLDRLIDWGRACVREMIAEVDLFGGEPVFADADFNSMIRLLSDLSHPSSLLPQRPQTSPDPNLEQLIALQKTFVSGITSEDDFFSEEKGRVLHINTATWADVTLIAPASANTLCKVAHGITDNFLLSVVRAVPRGRRVYLAPAMNTEMWFDPATQAAAKLLKSPKFARKYAVIPPIEKTLRCGTTGIGAMEEPSKIFSVICGAQ